MIYFDNSATSRFKPKKVIETVTKEIVNSSNSGRGAHNDAIRSGLAIFQTRQKILEYFNASDHNVIFTKNCSEALNLAIQGASKIGGHIITTCYEHNSVLRTLNALEKSKNIGYDVLFPKNHLEKAKALREKNIPFINEEMTITADQIEKHIRPNTYMVIVNHISNVTGTEQNIKEIAYLCKKYSLLLLIDGAQSVGHKLYDMDKYGIGMLATSGHKGISGVQGTGFLIVDKAIRLNHILYGGTGTNSASLVQPADSPEGFEVGTLNTPGILGLSEAIDFNKENFERINMKISHLTKELLNGLMSNKKIIIYSPIDTTNGIVTFNVRDVPSDFVAKKLNDDYDIAVRAGLHCAPLAHKCIDTFSTGACRASIGFNNNIDDVEDFINAINEISK